MEAESKPHPTLGEFLQRAREKKGLSLEYIADRLKLKVSTVKALEADYYDDIGGLVYVKGYLRTYAKLVNANIDQALDLITLSSESGSHKKNLSQHRDKSNQAQSVHALDQWNIWLPIFLLILVAVIAFAWHYYHAKLKQEETILPSTAIAVTNAQPRHPSAFFSLFSKKSSSHDDVLETPSPMPTVIEHSAKDLEPKVQEMPKPHEDTSVPESSVAPQDEESVSSLSAVHKSDENKNQNEQIDSDHISQNNTLE